MSQTLGQSIQAAAAVAGLAMIISTIVEVTLRPKPAPPIAIDVAAPPASLTISEAKSEATVRGVPLGEWNDIHALALGDIGSANVGVVLDPELGAGVLGLYEPARDTVRLAPRILADAKEHRGVLLHELAHRFCGDGHDAAWSRCALAIGVPQGFETAAIFETPALVTAEPPVLMWESWSCPGDPRCAIDRATGEPEER